MGVLGKVLAVLNVLAIAGFVTLAVMDYGKREAWAAYIKTTDFVRDGIPVNDKDLDADGDPVAPQFTNRMKQELFSGVSSPVSTQEEEVKARQKAAEELINGQATDADKKAKLKAVLLPLKQTEGEREELRLQIDGGKVEELMGQGGPFEKAFEPAYKPNSALDQRKKAIAHILINLGERPENYLQRAAVVVGVSAYVQELESQTSAYDGMIPVIMSVLAQDRAEFEARHRALITQIVELAERVRDLRDNLAKQQALRDQHRVLVGRRKDDVAQMQTQIDDARKSLAQALAVQSDLEKQLFAAQQAIGAASAENLKLERDLRNRETGR